MGESSQRVLIDGKASCTGTNLHAVWDSKLLEAATGFVHPDDALAFAQQLRPFLQRVQAAEPPLTAGRQQSGGLWSNAGTLRRRR